MEGKSKVVRCNIIISVSIGTSHRLSAESPNGGFITTLHPIDQLNPSIPHFPPRHKLTIERFMSVTETAGHCEIERRVWNTGMNAWVTVSDDNVHLLVNGEKCGGDV